MIHKKPSPAPEAIRGMSNLERVQLEINNREKQVVLAQPHRQGRLSELRESALGRFVEDYQCGIECYNGGVQYMLLVYKWRLASGISVPIWVREEFGGTGSLMDANSLANFADTVRNWNLTIKGCERVLSLAGHPVSMAARRMIFDNCDPRHNLAPAIKRSLVRLGKKLGRIPY